LQKIKKRQKKEWEKGALTWSSVCDEDEVDRLVGVQGAWVSRVCLVFGTFDRGEVRQEETF
jgi:hypothetical protein